MRGPQLEQWNCPSGKAVGSAPRWKIAPVQLSAPCGVRRRSSGHGGAPGPIRVSFASQPLLPPLHQPLSHEKLLDLRVIIRSVEAPVQVVDREGWIRTHFEQDLVALLD